MSIIKNRLTKKFLIAPTELTTAKISHAAFRMYCYLVSKPDGWKVLNNDISKQLGIKDSGTISKCWKQLIETGWVTRSKNRDDKGNFSGGYDYTLNEAPFIDKNVKCERPICGKNPELDNTHNSEKPVNNNNTILSNNNEYSIKYIKEKNIKKEKSTFVIPNGFSENEKEAIKEFIEHRDFLKSKFSNHAFNLFINRLTSFKAKNYDIIEIINNAIVSGWKTVYEPKPIKQSTKPTPKSIQEWLHNCNDNFVESEDF